MDYSPSQVSFAGISPVVKWAALFHNRLRQLNISLLTETAIVAVAAILAIRAFSETLTPGVMCFASSGNFSGCCAYPDHD